MQNVFPGHKKIKIVAYSRKLLGKLPSIYCLTFCSVIHWVGEAASKGRIEFRTERKNMHVAECFHSRAQRWALSLVYALCRHALPFSQCVPSSVYFFFSYHRTVKFKKTETIENKHSTWCISV